ncbi:MAG: Rieske (2Fe-2S) iron-sulfur domain protein [halophilic archaeon J07HX64]|jgi:Ferredoxin subunits of nitrite reductase and ring-hydroxylating dioxygenases|nr:MAG: Rieske (2Fe-2S) iron-sulfur domain protein [halophilic archaeon J07HX64]
MATDQYVPVAERSALEDEGRTVVSEDGKAIALFYHRGEIHAVDNRCPHMGFPLTRGTVEDGVLTCHWHHARFELEEGDTFDPWADDVQTFPVELRDGTVYLDPDPEQSVPPATRWRNRLADGLQENLSLVMAKGVIGLGEEGEGFDTPLETAVKFGTTYRDSGWGRGLTTLSYMADLYPVLGVRDRRRALYTGVRAVADDCADQPPRFQQPAFENRTLSKNQLKGWFRENCEVRDADGAERCLLTAIETLPPGEVAELLVTAATDHLYLDAGHTLDFLNSALSTVEQLGWDHAPGVLAATVPRFTEATRFEEQSSWRQPVDVATLCFDAHDRLPELVAAGEKKSWTEPEGFVETLLSDDAEAIVEALCDAIADGATRAELTDAVARAATRRVAYFTTNNEFNDWNTVHHTFVYANAAHELTDRTDATELYRACFDGAISVYLDRFLNSPRAPVPEPGDSSRDPETVREELLGSFDEQGAVNRAGRLVSEHFDAGGDPTRLKRVLGRGLLREDVGFHTNQNVGAAIRRFDALDDPEERRLALIAGARYLAAHTPTRRENEQTFSIATRLHRGERLHETG